MKTVKHWTVISILTFFVFSLVFTDCKTNDGDVKINSTGGSITSPIGIELVLIPAGTFIMGSPASEPSRFSDETQHSVKLTKSFYMGKYLVTQKQYRAVMGAREDRTTTRYGKGDNYPVYYVNWFDAIIFCNKLSIMEGLAPVYSINGNTAPDEWGTVPYFDTDRFEIIGDIKVWNGVVMDKSKNGYRLPTEAEWEYACRGDYPNKAKETNTKPFGIGDGTKITGRMANFNGGFPYDLARSGEYDDERGTYLGKMTKVGNYAANNYGLFDMHGNLFEWCWDRYKADITADKKDPTGAVTGFNRVKRGEHWESIGHYMRSACRGHSNPCYRSWLDDVPIYGFRLVRSN